MNLAGSTGHSVLDRLGLLTDCATLIAELDEPLRDSARINYRTALELCADNILGVDCCAYHAIWQYLRLADVARAVRVDGPLFVDAAERFARAGRLNRVLVSGTADYSMLAHLAHGAARAGRRPQFDVLDTCATTLSMNSWYARVRKLDVRVIQDSVHDFEPDEQYDLICTHSFLPWHPAERRPALFQRWGSWLVPGGHLCFSNRVSATGIPFDPQERVDRIARMIEKVRTNLKALDIPLPCPEADFIDLIRRFGDRRREGYPELGLDKFRSWISDAGLVLDICVDVAKVLPGPEDVMIISGTTAPLPRMWFQARRP